MYLVINYSTLARLFAGIIFLIALSSCTNSEPSEIDKSSSEEHEGEELIQLSDEEIAEFGVTMAVASSGTLGVVVTLPGEVKINKDRYAHIVPRVSGVVHSVHKSAGEEVKAGEVLAVLDSRDLADIKSEYLAGIERLSLSEAVFQREKSLFEKKISSEQEFLEARQTMTENQIALRSARQKLLALGFSEKYISSLPDQPEHALVHYNVTAPISGTIVEKHISQGEAMSAEREAFSVADLRTVWVDLSVFQKDLDLINKGQEVSLATTGDRLTDKGEIQFVKAIIGEETRTAIARIELANPDGRWKPGLFVTGEVAVDRMVVPLLIPRTAVVRVGEEELVFVREEHGISPRNVILGRKNDTMVEVTSGLLAGELFVDSGGFILKAELEKEELGEGHSH